MAIRLTPDAFNPLKGPVTYIDRQSVSSKTSDTGTGKALVASPYGQPIPILFGKVIVDGVPFWSSEVINTIETTTTTDSETIVSRGYQANVPIGSSQVSNIIGSTASFAVAFGTRAPGVNKCVILRLWVNAQLVYDQTDGTSIVDSGQYKYRLYAGDESQMPDPTIVANEGVKTPAARGMIYAVFDDFPLPDSGGVFPNIMAEISCTSSTQNPVTPFQANNSGTPTYRSDVYLINWDAGELYCMSGVDWDVYDMDNAVKKSANTTPTISNDVLALSADGDFAYAYQFGGNSSAMVLLSARTGAVLGTYFTPGSSGSYDDTHMVTPTWFAALQGSNGVEEYMLTTSLVGGRCAAFERNGLDVKFHAEYTVVGGNFGIQIPAITNGRNKYFNPAAMAAAPQVDLTNFAFFYFLKFGNVYRVLLSKNITPSSQTAQLPPGEFPLLYLPRIKSGGTDPLTNSWTMAAGEDGITLTDIAFGANEFAPFAMTGPADDPWLTVLVTNDVLEKSWVRRYDSMWNRKDYAPQDLQFLDDPSAAHMTPVFNIEIPYHIFSSQNFFISQTQRRPGSYWMMFDKVGPGGFVELVNFETGEVQEYNENGATFVNSGNSAITYGFAFSNTNTFDPLTGTAVYPVAQGSVPTVIYPGRAALWVTDDNGLLLSTLLLQYCLAAGYVSGDIDVTGVVSNDTTVIGSIINVSVDLAQLLGQVCELFRVDVVESQGKIKFSRKSRGAGLVPDFDFIDADLASLQQSSDNDRTLVDGDRNPSLLPSILVTNYLDYDHLCAIGSQSAKRSKFPAKTTKLIAQETLNVPVVMTAADALYWTTFCLFDQWAGDTSCTIRTGQKNMVAEPGDLVKLTRDDGKVYLMKAETTIVNGDLSTSIIARTFNQYLNPVVPPAIPGLPRDKLIRVTDATLFMLDNFLYDPASDPGDGSALPYRYSVDTAAVLQILRGSNYVNVDVTTQSSVTGSIVGTLADRPYNVMFQTDTAGTITIHPLSGDPDSIQSVSDDEFWDGLNAVAIGASDRWELIYFKTVTHNADKSITLSTLLRGRRGTDVFAGSHATTDKAIFLPFLPLTFPVAELGITEKFRVGNLNAPSRPAIIETWSSNGGPLKPWAPAQVAAAYSSTDIVLTWVRRTRLATELHDLNPDTPLGEATEKYEVDIYKAGVVVRTYAGLTTPTATYTTADQTTDTNTGLTSIHVAVYQISAVVGRGWARNLTVAITP